MSVSGVTAKVAPQDRIVVSDMRYSDSISLGSLSDIDISSLGDGAVLIYNDVTDKWEAKQEIENTNTIINGGFF